MNERAGGEGAAGDDEGGAPGLVGKGRRGAKARCPRAAPSPASSNPGRWNVWRLRSAVMRSPQPVALSMAAGVRELDGCAFRRAVIAKKAASRMTTSSAITSKPLVSLYSEAAGVEDVG